MKKKDKNKEKEDILCVTGEFIQCRAYFRDFLHAMVTFMKKSFSEMLKKVSIFRMLLCIFVLFHPYFTLFLKN